MVNPSGKKWVEERQTLRTSRADLQNVDKKNGNGFSIRNSELGGKRGQFKYKIQRCRQLIVESSDPSTTLLGYLSERHKGACDD